MRRHVSPSQTVYEPLDPSRKEIRLVRVEPFPKSSEDSGLCCTVYKYSTLQQDLALPYYTLSYVWGPGEVEILINGQPRMITKNLASFLLHWRDLTWANDPVVYTDAENGEVGQPLRRIKVLLDLWIDALSINQDDIAERNSQVAAMAERYTGSECTIAWLGPKTSDSDRALSAVAAIHRCIKALNPKTRRPEDRFKYISQMHPSFFKAPNRGYEVNETWESIRNLFLRNSYWRRRWIFQELVLPVNILAYCGSTMVHVSAIFSLVQWLSDLRYYRGDPLECDSVLWARLSRGSNIEWLGLKNLSYINSTRNQREKSRPEITRDMDWHRLLHSTAFCFEATDPRDHLYANLGIVGVNASMRPQYELAVENVYVEYAKLYARSRGRLSFLREGNPCGSLKEGSHYLFVPTWAPNWDRLSKLAALTDLIKVIEDGEWHADGNPPQDFGQKWQFSGGNFGQILQAVGFGVGVASAIVIPRADVEDHSTYVFGDPFLEASFLLSRIMHHNSQYPAHQGKNSVDRLVINPLLNLAFLDGYLRYQREPVTYPEVDMIAELYLWRHFNKNVGSVFDDQLTRGTRNFNEPELEYFWKKMHKLAWDHEHLAVNDHRRLAYVHRHCLFLTKEGHVGWGPRSMKLGDVVTIIAGCEVPLVLRSVDDHWINLGPAFVPGIMQGETISRMGSSWKDNVRSFRLM